MVSSSSPPVIFATPSGSEITSCQDRKHERKLRDRWFLLQGHLEVCSAGLRWPNPSSFQPCTSWHRLCFLHVQLLPHHKPQSTAQKGRTKPKLYIPTFQGVLFGLYMNKKEHWFAQYGFPSLYNRSSWSVPHICEKAEMITMLCSSPLKSDRHVPTCVPAISTDLPREVL